MVIKILMTEIRGAKSLTRHLKILLYEANVFLCIFRKLLKGPCSGGVAVPARQSLILDLNLM